MRIVITGAAGFIGGQILLAGSDAGHSVLAIDRQPLSATLAAAAAQTLECGFESADDAIISFQPDAIIHCAATSLVGPSVTDPAAYWTNNVVNTLGLMDLVRTHLPCCRFIFSSSAAVLGNPLTAPCVETDPCVPISPYGHSKWMTEIQLRSYGLAYGLDWIAFRFFNACGADPRGRHGQARGATHLIARLVASVRDGQPFVLYGTDWPTVDGSCVRDYVHVQDIAQAHLRALDAGVPSGVYHLGSGTGWSNRQVVAAAERATGQRIPITEGPRRPGDPAILVASAAKFRGLTGWSSDFSLDLCVSHAKAWYNKENI